MLRNRASARRADYASIKRYRFREKTKKETTAFCAQIAYELTSSSYQVVSMFGDKRGLVPSYINAAAKELYGVDSAQEGQALDHPAYHLAILLQHRTKLQKIAYGMLVESGQLGQNLQRFAAQ